jgi:hypothetical protein
MHSTRSRSPSPLRLPFAFTIALAAAGCAELNDAESLGETSQELLVSSWSGTTYQGSAQEGGQVGSIGGEGISVRTRSDNSMVWNEVQGPVPIAFVPGETSSTKVSLAAFNGFLYMVHSDTISPYDPVWLSRFDPTTKTWSTNYQIPYTSSGGPPAIAAFGKYLRFVGTTPGTLQMWTATMTADQVFSVSTPIPGHTSLSRVSATVFGDKLFVAHRAGQSATIALTSFDGTSWTADEYLPFGALGADLRGYFMHLIHRTPESSNVLWTYYDGCNWAAEVSVGNLTTNDGPSLTQGGPGLLLGTTDSNQNFYVSTFTAPPPPLMPPRCAIHSPPPG